MSQWTNDDGLTDVTSAFEGFTQPLGELLDDIHRRGWTVAKIKVKDGQFVAEGKSPHGEKLEATGRTDATAAANLLIKVMRREFMRGSSVRQKLGAWDHVPIEQQFNQIAMAYGGAPVYDPKAAPAWMDLAQDCGRRALTIRQQIVVEYTDDPTPYENADELREDVTKKRHVVVTRAYATHPVWSQPQMLDYRLVVDVLGHTVSGGDWGWHGTCMAFAALAPLLAELPQKALYTELLGQAAFGAFYRTWGPQKIVFLEELIDKEQAKENGPGHHPVHPSQSIVPMQLPSVFTSVAGPVTDPNANWESGVTPMPDNAYMWQRDESGLDPLNVHDALDQFHMLEPGISNMHPQMAKQAVVNALRSSLLGSRSNDRDHAIHYQDLMNIPADVDDPMAYQDALEGQRERWNQAQGYAPGSHKQFWAQEQQLKQWIKAQNPQLHDGDVARAAKREVMHMLIEEEERVLAQDQGEQLPAEVIQHEAYEALKKRLKGLTKPNVDQKVDFGEDHLYHEAADRRLMYHMSPATNRDSIQRSGLLPVTPDFWSDGVAPDEGMPEPDVDSGVYMWDHPEAFDSNGKWPHMPGQDIWAVDVSGLPLDADEAMGMQGSWYSGDAIPPSRLRLHRTATHHADMYPPYLTSRLRPMAQISRHADQLADAAREDLLSHKGHGHHFRATALNLGIPGLGPRQVSHAWMHVAPQTSQLAVLEPQLEEVLGHDYATDLTNRDYFKHERELAAGRDSAGYGHVPLGGFSAALYDLKSGGPGFHPDRTVFKPYGPSPHQTVDWNAQQPTYPDWGDPYWWQSTQPARDQAGQDFDRNVAVNFSRDEVPFQRMANSPALPCPTCGGPLDYLLTRNENNAYCPRCKTTTEIGLDEPREAVHYREGVIPAGLEGGGLPWGVLPQRQGSEWQDPENPDYIEGHDGQWGGPGENYNPHAQPPGEKPIYIEMPYTNSLTGEQATYRGPVMKIIPFEKRGEQFHSLVINPMTTLTARPGDYTIIPTDDLNQAPEVGPDQPEHFARTAMQWDDGGNLQPVYDLKPGEKRYPWITHPTTGERVSGAPGTSIMQHAMTTFGHQDPREVWAQEYEVGKDAASAGTIAKMAMAERSGFPELDQAIEEFMRSDPEIATLRDPQLAWGRCQEIAEQCAAFLKERGFRAYAPSDEVGMFPGYQDAQDTAAIGAGDFSYPEHAVVEVYGLYGPHNVNNVTIDFTASQYGFTEFPKVHGGPADAGTTAKVADWNPSANTVRSWYDPQAVKPFGEHSPEVQAALQRYEEDAALDAGDWDGEETTRPQIPPGTPFGYARVPMSDFTTALLTRLRAEGDTWDDWDAYHRSYASNPDMPNHGSSRWPVLTDPNLVVDDGFHRLHDYYRQGDQEVPIVWSP